MSKRRHTAQPLVALFILVALAVETVPLLIVSINRIESPHQFIRTVITLALSTALTLGLGVWLFTRATRRLNEEREESEHIYQGMFASIQSPVVAFREDLLITFCNDAWAELMGGQSLDLIGRKVPDVMPGWEDTKLRIAYKAVLATGWQQQYSVTYRGREYDVWLWRTAEGVLLFSDDISQEREVEAELAQARQQRAEMTAIQRTVATVAHEINNPLAAQLLLLQAIEDDMRDREPVKNETREMVRQAIAQGKRMGETVDALQQVTEPAYKTYVGNTQMLDITSSGPRGSAIT
jgi:PAS domain S-box-containing protein